MAKRQVEPAPGAVNSTLTDLLARLAAEPAGAADVSVAELDTWPPDDLAALKASGLLMAGATATRIECPGCEQACAMNVEVLHRTGRPPLCVVVCDKRDDIGRVTVPAAALEQWRTTRQGVAGAVARLLGSSAAPVSAALADFRVGTVQGRDGSRPVFLAWSEHGPTLNVAGHTLELAPVLRLAGDALRLNMQQLIRCVDAPAGADSNPPETPEERHLRYVALLDGERRINPRGCLKRAVAKSGVKESAFKQVVYRKAKPKAALEHMASAVTRPGSKKLAR